MEAVKTPILEGITLEEQEQMRVCFGVREERFRAGETVYDFAEGRKYLGLIARGSAVIQRIDHQGGRTILEHLESGGVFGEMLMFENVAGDSITVIAEEPCRVWFMQDEHMTRRCEKACAHHSRLDAVDSKNHGRKQHIAQQFKARRYAGQHDGRPSHLL